MPRISFFAGEKAITRLLPLSSRESEVKKGPEWEGDGGMKAFGPKLRSNFSRTAAATTVNEIMAIPTLLHVVENAPQ